MSRHDEDIASDYGIDRDDEYDDWEGPEEYEAAQRRAEEPPDSYLEEEAMRYAQIHNDREHGGGECDCPVTGPEYAEEPPF